MRGFWKAWRAQMGICNVLIANCRPERGLRGGAGFRTAGGLAGFFLDQCLYKMTTADNHEKGYQAGLIYADSRAMLKTGSPRCGRRISMSVNVTGISSACR